MPTAPRSTGWTVRRGPFRIEPSVAHHTQAVRSRSRGAPCVRRSMRGDRGRAGSAAPHPRASPDTPPVVLDVEDTGGKAPGSRRRRAGCGAPGRSPSGRRTRRWRRCSKKTAARSRLVVADQQQPPAPVFLRDRGHHAASFTWRSIRLYSGEGIVQRLAEQHGADAVAEDQHVAGRDFGEDPRAASGLVRAKEGEGRDQRAGRGRR